MTEPHRFEARLAWTGAAKGPTASPETFARDFRAEAGGRPPILGNAPPEFHGDGEQLRATEQQSAHDGRTFAFSFIEDYFEDKGF